MASSDLNTSTHPAAEAKTLEGHLRGGTAAEASGPGAYEHLSDGTGLGSTKASASRPVLNARFGGNEARIPPSTRLRCKARAHSGARIGGIRRAFPLALPRPSDPPTSGGPLQSRLPLRR